MRTRRRDGPVPTPAITERHASVILDAIADGVFTVDNDWRITSFNQAAARITGIARDEALGRRCCEVFRATVCESDCVLRRSLQTGKAEVGRVVRIITAQGDELPISVSTGILTDTDGAVVGGVETFRDLSEVEQLRRDLRGQRTTADIVTASPRMQQLLDMVPAVAASDSSVLICGESGTGKELVARALHHLGPRRAKPLVTVNCGALPETLLESELFGYKRGAFTDARTDKPGRFALAESGTLFLDEIGDLPAAVQVKLLRVLQERVYEPLGATRPAKADVRLVTATNRDLEALVASGQFRRDLYYRINVVRLPLPPLRERREDIPLLVEHFIDRFNRIRHREISGIAREALDLLEQHDYPGNVRELENAIEHAFVLCHRGPIHVDHLPPTLRRVPTPGRVRQATTLPDLERDFLRDLLQKHRHDRAAAARELGIHPVTLWRKLKRHRLLRGGRK